MGEKATEAARYSRWADQYNALKQPGKIKPVTTTILGGEKAWDYLELDLQSPRSRGFHRYRIIFVNRDDTITEYREDMGSSKKFKGARATIHIPSLFEHTVDELIELAQELRYEHKGDEYDVREIVGAYPFNQPWKPKNYIEVTK